jgi:Ca2+-binding RTX toxin-like protein
MTELEPRLLFAVDFSVVLTPEAGSYAVGDAVPVSVSMTNSGGSTAGAVTASVILSFSTDKVLGNADDFPAGASANPTSIPAGGTRTFQSGLAVGNTIPDGDYYIGGQVQGVNETNTSNNTFITPTIAVRIVSGTLTSDTILGTSGNDVITFEHHSGAFVVVVNGVGSAFTTEFDHLFVDGGAGNDRIFCADGKFSRPLQITGGGGNDTIVGGTNDDELSGANGKDKVFGGLGDDFCIGGAQPDSLWGEDGDDLLLGAGGNDRLTDVTGRDYFIGGAGNDTFICRDTTNTIQDDPDTISGNAGSDRAQLNDVGSAIPDLYTSIEELLA